MRQIHLRTSEGRKTEKTGMPKGNIFAAFAQGGTDREGEDEGSEFELGKLSKGGKKTLRVLQARRVKEMPQTPTREPTRGKISAATKEATKDNRNAVMKTLIAIIEELKANKA